MSKNKFLFLAVKYASLQPSHQIMITPFFWLLRIKILVLSSIPLFFCYCISNLRIIWYSYHMSFICYPFIQVGIANLALLSSKPESIQFPLFLLYPMSKKCILKASCAQNGASYFKEYKRNVKYFSCNPEASHYQLAKVAFQISDHSAIAHSTLSSAFPQHKSLRISYDVNIDKWCDLGQVTNLYEP